MIGMTMAHGAAGVRCLQGFTLLVGATELIKLTEHQFTYLTKNMDYLRRIGFIFQGQGLIGCNGLCLGPSVFNIVFIKIT